MKNVKKIGLVIIGLLFASSSYATGPRVSPSLISSASEIYTVKIPPFIDEGSLQEPYISKVVNAIFLKQKIDAILTTLPLHNMVKYYLLNDNALAVLSPYMYLSNKQKQDRIIIPIDEVDESYLYYKPAHPNGLAWKGDLKNLKGMRYGVEKGISFAQYKKAGVMIKVSRMDDMLKKLVNKEIDFIRLPDLTLDWLIKRQYPEQTNNFVKMDVKAGVMSLVIVFNKSHKKGKESAALFKEGLEKMVENGQFSQTKYHSISVKE